MVAPAEISYYSSFSFMCQEKYACRDPFTMRMRQLIEKENDKTASDKEMTLEMTNDFAGIKQGSSSLRLRMTVCRTRCCTGEVPFTIM